MRESIKNRIDAVRRGEVPEGYRTERAMLFPNEWGDPVPLNTVLTENKDRNEDLHFGKEDVLSVSGEQGIINQIDLLGRSYAGESVAAYHIVETGDVVYTKSPLKENPYGIIKQNHGVPGIVSTLYAVYHCNSPITGQYLENYFSIDTCLNNYLKPLVKRGAKNDMKVNNEDVLLGRIPLPSLQEQERINEIIAQFDRALELKKKLLEEKRRQKQWLMQKLLDPSSGVRLPGFENSIWQKATMSSLFDFGSSMAKSRDELSDEGDLYLHYGDIHANERYYIDATKEYDSIPKYEGISPEKTHLHSGDVVFIDASEDYDGISKFVVIENCDGLTFISGLHTVPCHSRDDRLTLHFKRYCFQTYLFKKQMAYYANGMKVYGVSGKDFAKVEIVFPGHEEQRAIANVLDAISTNIELLQDEVKAMEVEKKALMQLLLTGLVRVNT